MKFDRTLIDLGNINELTEVNAKFIGEREHGERICSVSPSCMCIKYGVDTKSNTVSVRIKTGVLKGQQEYVENTRSIVITCTDNSKVTLYIKYKLVR